MPLGPSQAPPALIPKEGPHSVLALPLPLSTLQQRFAELAAIAYRAANRTDCKVCDAAELCCHIFPQMDFWPMR
jgi:hypothetical protein